MSLVTDEADLVVRARAGDKDAFTALYHAYVDRIHDFCFQMTRNREDAADLTSDVFLTAMQRLNGLKDPMAFKGWLYAIARNASLNLVGKRRRTTRMPENFEVAVPVDRADADPTLRAEQAELTTLVWAAAAELSPRDYSVFEMTARQDLAPDQVATALGIKTSNAYVLIDRVRRRVEDALSVVIVARAGRRDCAVLDAMVAEFGAERSPRRRKALVRHIRSCEVCSSNRTKYASAAALLRGVPAAVPLPGLLEGVSQQIDEGWETRRRRRLRRPRVSRRGKIAAGVGAGVVGIALIASIPAGGPAEVARQLGGRSVESEQRTGPGISDSPQNGSGPVATIGPTASTGPGVDAGAFSVSVSDSPGTIFTDPCGPQRSTVRAVVETVDDVASVVLRVEGRTTPMVGSRSVYELVIGPYPSPRTVSYEVVATTAQGTERSVSGAVEVVACPAATDEPIVDGGLTPVPPATPVPSPSPTLAPGPD